MNVLDSYCQGFARAGDPWPPLPLPAAAELGWWQALLAGHGGERLARIDAARARHLLRRR